MNRFQLMANESFCEATLLHALTLVPIEKDDDMFIVKFHTYDKDGKRLQKVMPMMEPFEPVPGISRIVRGAFVHQIITAALASMDSKLLNGSDAVCTKEVRRVFDEEAAF